MLMLEDDMTEDPGRGPSMGCKVLTWSETRHQVGGKRDFKTGILRISIIYECLQFVIHCGRISYVLGSQTHKINPYISVFMGFPDGSGGKESACKCRRYRFDPWVRKIPWRRKWQPILILLPEK